MAIVIGNLRIGNLWKSQTEIFHLVISHVNRYPKMQVYDVYKMLYQGALGPAHAIQSASAFESRLFDEMSKVQLDENVPLWENIRPDGAVVRINLAKFKAKTGDPVALSTICLWTASTFESDVEDLHHAWNGFIAMCRENRMRKFALEEVEEFTSFLESNHFPPVHHSRIYQETYHPAYRLVRREFLAIVGG